MRQSAQEACTTEGMKKEAPREARHRREEASGGGMSKGSRELDSTGPSATQGSGCADGGSAAQLTGEEHQDEAAHRKEDMPPCRMFLDADSLSQATSTSIRGWRAGNALLGCIASMDEHRRILLVTSSEDVYLITDLTMPYRQGGHDRPRIGLDRLP